ncbi:MAG: hypothetical protein DLM60_08920 [Pseudonocardiales bacterium]|nr:MAG: hypothetical protein DLM60_08920 [Pseudonocardiales bacterium]
MWPFDDIGGALGDGFKNMVGSAFEAAMTAIWQASLAVLRTAFGLADQFSVFSVSTTEGPLKVVWPMMLWISGVLAIGLFSWQLIMTNLRGGRGFMRLVTGPVQYGIALAVTVGMVAAFLVATDGLTDGILTYGLGSKNFTDALSHTSFGAAAEDGVKAVVLGICAIVGVIPAAIGYVLEMLFREAAIYVLVCTVPLVAAGLLAGVSAPWFWKTARWLLAAIVMKPALALTLVLGVAITGGSQGMAGLLAGVGVLVISLFAPFLLFELFAFVDPHSDAGGAFREFLSGEGMDSYGPNNPALALAGAGGGSGAMEAANTGRFDDSIAGYDEDSLDGSGESCAAGHDEQDARQDSSAGGGGSGRGSGPGGGDDPPPLEPPGEGGGGPPHPDDGGGPRGGGPGGPHPDGGGAGAAEEAAVII